MGIETLLEAARFVEWQARQKETAREHLGCEGEKVNKPLEDENSPGLIPCRDGLLAQRRDSLCPGLWPQKQDVVSCRSPLHERPLDPLGVSRVVCCHPCPSNGAKWSDGCERPESQRSPCSTSPGAFEGALLQEIDESPAASPVPCPETHSIDSGCTTPPVAGPSVRSPRGSPQTSEDSTLGVVRRRPGLREAHNKLEKHRRAQLKEAFEMLKKEVPTLHVGRTSNLEILCGAFKYIQTLKRKERQQEHEKEHLVRQKIAMQQRLVELRKEMGQFMDADEVDLLVWQAGQQLPHKLPQQDDDQTSTASEAESMEGNEGCRNPQALISNVPIAKAAELVPVALPEVSLSCLAPHPPLLLTCQPVPQTAPKHGTTPPPVPVSVSQVANATHGWPQAPLRRRGDQYPLLPWPSISSTMTQPQTQQIVPPGRMVAAVSRPPAIVARVTPVIQTSVIRGPLAQVPGPVKQHNCLPPLLPPVIGHPKNV
uniref:max-binding protein MNT n=1 Tax=Myxine glutinosa TaxID=7769 RepID=UPI00358E86CC